MRLFKCVILGHTQAGKSSLLRTYINKTFCGNLDATTNELYTIQIQAPNGYMADLQLWDTSGLVTNDYISRLYFPNTDVFLICYSAADGAAIVLVATKTDLRDDVAHLKKWNLKAINYEAGQQLAAEIKALKYLECSALEEVGVSAVFDAVEAACVKNCMSSNSMDYENEEKHGENEKLEGVNKCSIM
uniref:Uncharacterized protein n=1 Tax=Stomoxys calcitrans TaxID=35570 RepID=A0A1I8Q527_STOCA